MISKSYFCQNKGFDAIAASGLIILKYKILNFSLILRLVLGEEVMNPKRNIPIGIIIALVLCCVFYVSSSSVLSLMIPYYMADTGRTNYYFFYQMKL